MTKEPMQIPLINDLNLLFLNNRILGIFLIGVQKMLKFRNLRRKMGNNSRSSFLIRISSILENNLSKNRRNKKNNKKKNNKKKKWNKCPLKFTETEK